MIAAKFIELGVILVAALLAPTFADAKGSGRLRHTRLIVESFRLHVGCCFVHHSHL